jgi:hypothetical protein
MYKQLFVAAAMIATATSAAGFAAAHATQDNTANTNKITICHRTDAPKNPYRRITISVNAADGKGKNDHSHHEGDVATSFTQAVEMKSRGEKWGDIIPEGLNWTAEGQSVYNNDCRYPTPEQKYADIDYEIACQVEAQTAVVTFTNTGTKDGMAILNDEVLTVTTSAPLVKSIAIATGGTQIKISIEGELVLDKVYVCEPGKGSVNPTTPTPPATPTDSTVTPAGTNSSTADVATSLPYTAGNNTQLIAVISSAIAAMIAIVSTIVKKTYLKQL